MMMNYGLRQVLHGEGAGHLLLQHDGGPPAEARLVTRGTRRRLGDGQRVPGGGKNTNFIDW